MTFLRNGGRARYSSCTLLILRDFYLWGCAQGLVSWWWCRGLIVRASPEFTTIIPEKRNLAMTCLQYQHSVHPSRPLCRGAASCPDAWSADQGKALLPEILLSVNCLDCLMARKSPRMEQRILYMLTNTLILFNWASCSAKIPEDVTVSQNSSDFTNVSSSQTPYSPHSYVDLAKECWSRYTLMMENVEHENLCEWQKVNRPYSYLRGCLEDLADALKIAFPNDIAHGYIMMSHSTYFGNCTLILQELIDPPEHVLLALIFAPISIIPFLVTLVVCKSKTSEPQA